MNIPHSIESLVALPARRFFPSSKEDAEQIGEDLNTLSDYFSVVSKMPRVSIDDTHMIEKYRILLRSYRGLHTGKRQIIFFDEAI